jgi:hypothetical protein
VPQRLLEIALIAFTPAKQSAIQHESKLDSSRYDNRTEVRAENRTTSVRILHGYCDIPFDGDGGRNVSVWHSEEEVTLGHRRGVRISVTRLIFGTAIVSLRSLDEVPRDSPLSIFFFGRSDRLNRSFIAFKLRIVPNYHILGVWVPRHDFHIGNGAFQGT